MTGTIVFALSLLAQLGSGDIVSPIGPTSGNTTSGGTGGLNRSDANLEDAHAPFTGGGSPISTGSGTTGSGNSTGTTSSTSTGGSTSAGTPSSMPIGGTGTSGGISSGTGIGGSSMR